jgi:hypothetical protein
MDGEDYGTPTGNLEVSDLIRRGTARSMPDLEPDAGQRPGPFDDNSIPAASTHDDILSSGRQRVIF